MSHVNQKRYPIHPPKNLWRVDRIMRGPLLQIRSLPFAADTNYRWDTSMEEPLVP